MSLTRRLNRLLGGVLLYGLLIGMSVFMILPFIWMFSTSLKPQNEIFRLPPVIVSMNSNLDAYRNLVEDRNILRIVGNTFVIAAGATCLRLFFCSLGGYGFAKYKFPGRGALFGFLLGTMIVPFSITMVPLYVIMLRLKWIDTFWPLIIPGAANAFGIFFMRQYISTISDELLDAARIDGASEFGIYWRVVLPIIIPGLTSLGLIFFMQVWNDFLWPLVILKSPDNFTLPIAIRSMVGGVIGRPVYHLQMAASVISIIPLLIIFLVFQRRFVEGITAGAIRG
ncbi:MAG: carbohydrate ABC transporter permease [Anaerolineae bacterium]|jgi:ABC-type glycerol-3-phosphate transport system permease component